jgi:uncharacterized protein (DUF885 family)
VKQTIVTSAALAHNTPVALRQLAQEFWTWRAGTQPFTPDDISRIERPGGVRDWSAAAIERQRTQLATLKSQWRQIDPHSWPVHDQVDYRLVGSALARVRWELDVMRRWQCDPKFYLEQTLTAVQEALTVPGPYDETQSAEILTRIQNIPSILDSATQNLRHPPAPFAALVIGELDGIRGRLFAMADSLKGNTMLSGAELKAAVESTATALEQYRAWLQRIAPNLPQKISIGRDAYQFFLSNVALMPFTPEELLAMGRQELERAISFEQIERNRNADVPPLEIAHDLPTQIVRSVAAEAKIRDFLEKQNILTVPTSVAHYTIAPLPPYLKELESFGELIDFTSPSRLHQNATRYLDPPSEKLGYFWLATAKDPRPDMVHEGIPGHYLQFALSWLHPNPIRRHFYDSGANEGIAFYAEEMMLQAGLFDDSPRSREIIYNFARLRALRVEVDVKLALGLFDIEQAADFLERTVPMDRATARHEAAFFATGPGQAITYQIGKLQVLKFLADARLHLGERFQLHEFHDSLWLNGNVPIALQRWEMLRPRDEIDRIDATAKSVSAGDDAHPS